MWMILYAQFTREEVLAYEESILAEKYPDFRYIYEEYHDGILLFDIMDQKVWSKAVSDTVGLTAFYESHKTDYMWGQRYEAMVLTCTEDADLAGYQESQKENYQGTFGPGCIEPGLLRQRHCTMYQS